MSFKSLVLFLSVSLLLLANSDNAKAQQHQEVGMWVGFSNYVGDLNNNFSAKGVRPAGGFVYKYHLMEYIAFKGTLSYASLGFRDEWSSFPYHQARNLSFRTNLYEFTAQVELNFREFVPGDRSRSYSPYITAGVGLFRFNPKAKLDGEWYNLIDAGTEGQAVPQISGEEKYRQTQLCVPVGIGLKWWIKGPWTFSAEANYRSTFTDYLDDVSQRYVDNILFVDGSVEANLADRSDEVGPLIGDEGQQRGDSVSKDGYLFTSFSFTYTLFANSCPGNSTFKSKTRNVLF